MCKSNTRFHPLPTVHDMLTTVSKKGRQLEQATEKDPEYGYLSTKTMKRDRLPCTLTRAHRPKARRFKKFKSNTWQQSKIKLRKSVFPGHHRSCRILELRIKICQRTWFGSKGKCGMNRHDEPQLDLYMLITAMHGVFVPGTKIRHHLHKLLQNLRNSTQQVAACPTASRYFDTTTDLIGSSILQNS